MGNIKMGNGLPGHLKWLLLTGSLGLFLLVCGFYYGFQAGQPKEGTEEFRLQYAGQIEEAEQGNYESLKSCSAYIVGLDGRIIFSSYKGYKKGASVNLHSLSVSAKGEREPFISPLWDGKKQTGILVVNNGKKERQTVFSRETILVLLLLTFFFFLCLLGQYLYVQKQIGTPFKMLLKEMDLLVMGNFGKKALSCPGNGMQPMFQKLSLLRDELWNGRKQVQALYEGEKLLMASVSHDLKTPIATIAGCAECIRDGVIKKPEAVKDYMETILEKTALLTRFINALLEHTELTQTQSQPKRQEVYSKAYIEEILRELTPDIREKGLGLEKEEVPNVLLEIDPDPVFKVFQNIIGNSIKYTGEGGLIRIHFELCPGFLVVEIGDNGQGIDAADLPFVFDRFFRGEKARSLKKTDGSGLGLSIVKEIIRQHGGKVECDSILGEGTIVRFMLPCA